MFDKLYFLQAVKACHTLKVFHLHRSGLDDEKVRVLISHLLDHPSLVALGMYSSTLPQLVMWLTVRC